MNIFQIYLFCLLFCLKYFPQPPTPVLPANITSLRPPSFKYSPSPLLPLMVERGAVNFGKHLSAYFVG